MFFLNPYIFGAGALYFFDSFEAYQTGNIFYLGSGEAILAGGAIRVGMFTGYFTGNLDIFGTDSFELYATGLYSPPSVVTSLGQSSGITMKNWGFIASGD